MEKGKLFILPVGLEDFWEVEEREKLF